LLAAGHIDIVINAGPLIHDYAAVEPIIRNAGGVMTDWYGNQLTVASSNHVLALGDAELLSEAVRLLGFSQLDE